MLIEPKIPKGFRDFLPNQMAKRNFVMNKIKSVFEKFGYDTIETPVLEYAETLLGKYGEEAAKLVYNFEDFGGRRLALRYDQTVPFARLYAANNRELPSPFKRYQISRVWRADKPAKGRFREFYQCDIDIIGTENILAEGEVAKIITEVFTELKLPKFRITFNSRKLINNILDSLGIEEKNFADIIRVLDKMDKVGRVGVAKEVNGKIESGNLPKFEVEKLLDIVCIDGSNQEKVEKLKEFETAQIEEFLEICEDFGIPDESLVFNPALARGLDYYTGIIIEVILPEVNIGTVCAGGRYDDLTEMFSKNSFSGMGVAFGFDRIVTAMEDLNLLEEANLNSKILVSQMDKQFLKYNLEILNTLHEANINSEIYFEDTKLGKQFKYADKKEIPFVIVCGENEIQDQTVTIKEMKSGTQNSIPKSQLTSYIKGLLN